VLSPTHLCVPHAWRRLLAAMAPKGKGRAKAKGRSSTPVPRASPQKEAPKSPASPRTPRKASPSRGEPATLLGGLRQRLSPAKSRLSPAKSPAKPAKSPTKAAKKGKERSLWDTYLLLNATRPYVTKSISCAVIACLGDWICQQFVQGQDFDLERSLRFFLVNLAIVGPGLHAWGSLLGALVPVPGLKGALMQIVPDQLLFSPVFNWIVLSAIASASAFEPRRVHPTEWWECQQASWVLWPLVNTMIFWLSPPDLIVLWGSIFGVIWNIYVSMKVG